LSSAIMTMRVGMPFTEWPLCDRELWDLAANPDEFASDVQPLGAWSRRHQDLARYAYGMWLAFLAEHHAASIDESPGQRPTNDRVCHFVQHALKRLHPRTVAVTIVNLAGVLKSLEPGLDCKWMLSIARRVKRLGAASPPTPKPFLHAGALLGIGEELMLGACDAIGEVSDPVAFRDGLIIALLAAVPVRIHAFSCLRVGRHLRKRSTGAWTLDWEASETKGRREDHWSVPAFLVPTLETYLDAARPALQARNLGCPSSADHMWIGLCGQPIGDQTIRKIIKRRTAEALGEPIRPHAFRTSAATTFVLEHPEHAIEAAALLAHTDFRMTEKHYLAGRRQLAVRVAHGALGRLRRAGIELEKAVAV
jgi:integrase/recombinase XerD